MRILIWLQSEKTPTTLIYVFYIKISYSKTRQSCNPDPTKANLILLCLEIILKKVKNLSWISCKHVNADRRG